MTIKKGMVDEIGETEKQAPQESTSIENKVEKEINGSAAEIAELKRQLAEAKAEKMSPEKLKAQGFMTREEVVSMMKDGKVQNKETVYLPSGYVDADSIDPEDYLEPEQAVNFFAYKNGYVIADDKRRGVPVQLPFKNVISFINLGIKKEKIGNRHEITCYCGYSCQSKKEAQFLREHSKHGIEFFEQMSGAGMRDSQKDQKMALLINNINEMSPQQILASCKTEDIPYSKDIKEMRIALAGKLADKMVKEENENKQQKAANALLEQFMPEIRHV